jgi:hypothetical protein
MAQVERRRRGRDTRVIDLPVRTRTGPCPRVSRGQFLTDTNALVAAAPAEVMWVPESDHQVDGLFLPTATSVIGEIRAGNSINMIGVVWSASLAALRR